MSTTDTITELRSIVNEATRILMLLDERTLDTGDGELIDLLKVVERWDGVMDRTDHRSTPSSAQAEPAASAGEPFEFSPCDECGSRLECCVEGCKRSVPIDLSSPSAALAALAARAAFPVEPATSAAVPVEQQAGEWQKDALQGLVDVIKAAGLLNLSNGVQLGQTVWYVKASDALAAAEAALAAPSQPQPGDDDRDDWRESNPEGYHPKA